MTNDEAKFILNGYRPGGQDAGDATFCEAMEQAKRDPQLGAWFARAQAHDAAVAAKLAAVTPPAGLRESILAGGRMKPQRRTWSPAPWLAAAAGVAVLLTVVAVWRGQSADAAAPERLAEFALDDMIHGKHGGQGDAKAGLQQWLGTADVKLAAATLPVDFDTLRTTGCRVLRREGHDVIEVCFVRSGAEYHLYVVRREDMPGFPGRAAPAVIAKATGAAAVWSDKRYHYALVTDAGRDAMTRVL